MYAQTYSLPINTWYLFQIQRNSGIGNRRSLFKTAAEHFQASGAISNYRSITSFSYHCPSLHFWNSNLRPDPSAGVSFAGKSLEAHASEAVERRKESFVEKRRRQATPSPARIIARSISSLLGSWFWNLRLVNTIDISWLSISEATESSL